MDVKYKVSLVAEVACPKCGSANTGGFGDSLDPPSEWGCGDCGYREPYERIEPRQEMTLEELKEALENL